ncbi:MAG: hydroxyisourate hydrolase [Rikenellaceae bacterium]|nr:hydroxyisourate hydrolase [Rikenellaceae bacterium]
MKRILFTITAVFALSVCGAGRAAAQSGFQLSTHVLDINEGRPVAGITVHLYRYNEVSLDWEYIYQTKTDESGRVGDLLPRGNENAGIYKFRFDTSDYFNTKGVRPLFPFVEVVFTVTDKSDYHIPLAISGNGYSVYRGS